MLSFMLFMLPISFGLINGHGSQETTEQCHYTFESLDDAITVDTSTEVDDKLYKITVLRIGSDKRSVKRKVVLKEQSPYFRFKGKKEVMTSVEEGLFQYNIQVICSDSNLTRPLPSHTAMAEFYIILGKRSDLCTVTAISFVKQTTTVTTSVNPTSRILPGTISSPTGSTYMATNTTKAPRSKLRSPKNGSITLPNTVTRYTTYDLSTSTAVVSRPKSTNAFVPSSPVLNMTQSDTRTAWATTSIDFSATPRLLASSLLSTGVSNAASTVKMTDFSTDIVLKDLSTAQSTSTLRNIPLLSCISTSMLANLSTTVNTHILTESSTAPSISTLKTSATENNFKLAAVSTTENTLMLIDSFTTDDRSTQTDLLTVAGKPLSANLSTSPRTQKLVALSTKSSTQTLSEFSTESSTTLFHDSSTAANVPSIADLTTIVTTSTITNSPTEASTSTATHLAAAIHRITAITTIPSRHQRDNGGFFDKAENVAVLSALAGLVALCTAISAVCSPCLKCYEGGQGSCRDREKKKLVV